MIRRVAQEVRDNPGTAALAVYGAARGVHELYIKPTLAENPAVVAWSSLAAGVALYD